jgi:hypothetical protein
MDLHIAVIRDLSTGLKGLDADLTSWSLSGHNQLMRRAYRFPDPVAVVNARTWQRLNPNMIDEFRDRYSRYLCSFDGFVTTHTPALSELYAHTGKPQLVVASTRYEAPYTARSSAWEHLNSFLRREVGSSTMTLVSNNRGDADYLTYFTGLTPDVVPSVCDYLPPGRRRGNGRSVVLGRPGPAMRQALAAGQGAWTTLGAAYGTPYRWDQLSSSDEVFVLPYNISTMTLFELATAGTPVAVPSHRLAAELAAEDPTILSELSYFQVRGLSPASLPEGDPNDFSAPGFLEWWLARADFYDADLMPNIRIINDLSDLSERPRDRRLDSGYFMRIDDRNAALRRVRHGLIQRFLNSLS